MKSFVEFKGAASPWIVMELPAVFFARSAGSRKGKDPIPSCVRDEPFDIQMEFSIII